MDERGVAEPVLTALPRAGGWDGRATCRLWRELLDPPFGAWIAGVLQMASFPKCVACLSLYGPPTERRPSEPMPYQVFRPLWADGNMLRHLLFAAADLDPRVARWLARLLASTNRATADAATDAAVAAAAAAAICPVCERRGTPRNLTARSPRPDDTWYHAAKVVNADLMRALRLHVPLPTDRVDRVLSRASAAGNDLLVEWLVESPTVGTDWSEVTRAIEWVASPAIALALGQRFRLRDEFHRRYGNRVHDPCCAALERAADRGDWDVCRELVNQVGFGPHDVKGIFVGLVGARNLDAAQWLCDHVGVDQQLFLRQPVLGALAEAGDVATIERVARMLALSAADMPPRIWFAAARTGQTNVIEWLAASPLGSAASPLGSAASPIGSAASPIGSAASPLGSDASPLGSADMHQMLAIMIEFRQDDAVDWLTSRYRLDWRTLGRKVLTRATRELKLVTVVRLYERLALTSAALE
jgi:hypothetical protein